MSVEEAATYYVVGGVVAGSLGFVVLLFLIAPELFGLGVLTLCTLVLGYLLWSYVR